MNNKLNTIIDHLKSLTLLEAAELVTEIEKVFGVDTSNSQIIATAPVVSRSPVAVEEEKTSFDVILSEVPSDKKIAILKIVRNITGLGLKESKEIVDNAPKLVKEGVTKEDSENFKKDLETAGAKVIIK